MSLLKKLNEEYIEVHQAKEEEFWKSKMGHASYQKGSFEEREQIFKSWISDPKYLPQIRDELSSGSLSEEERVGLQGWLRFFETNSIEDKEALSIQKELIKLEGQLEAKRGEMTLGYTDPQSGEFVESSYGSLSLQLMTHKDEGMRKAAWEGLHKIGPFILENGFIEIIKQRNLLAKKLGYEDYYDYKVQLNEGISKKKLFEILDELEEKTKDTCQKSVDSFVAEHGEQVKKGWNFKFYSSGDLTKERDPYFGFKPAFDRWSRSFAAMNIEYNNATIQLDLLERKGKYHNGFMHGPFPGFKDSGEHYPAKINFTANAIPNEVGSGWNATRTLFHEGGHAAHFANIDMPSPCFSQEFAPTSVAFAETQSMFLDSLISDADWQFKYARNEAGEPIPFSIIEKSIRNEHKTCALQIRHMLTVSYVEKSIYEMDEKYLTAENIMRISESIEQKIQRLDSPSRPVMCIPHIISGEASAYYHGYTLAEMAVYQTRDYFLKKYGYITDNPAIGGELKKIYWQIGNAKDFLTLVQELTGEPFSARAIVEVMNQPIERLLSDAEKSIEDIKSRDNVQVDVDLKGNFKLVDGDAVIADSKESSISEMSQQFGAYVDQRFK